MTGDLGCQNLDLVSGIEDRHPGSATLVLCWTPNFIFSGVDSELMALHAAVLELCLGTPPSTHYCLEAMLFEEILKQGENSLASLEEAFLYILQSRHKLLNFARDPRFDQVVGC